jgi:hypothetical protein
MLDAFVPRLGQSASANPRGSSSTTSLAKAPLESLFRAVPDDSNVSSFGFLWNTHKVYGVCCGLSEHVMKPSRSRNIGQCVHQGASHVCLQQVGDPLPLEC